MILYPLACALFILEYANVTYETYNPETIKKKRTFVVKPFFYNRTTITLLVIIITLILLSYDYCSNNFGIDLQEEYAKYNEKDLMFGKMNICQYAIQKGFIDVLLFKNPTMSYILYFILTLLLLVFLYYSGIFELIFRTILDYMINVYNLDTIFPESGYIGNIAKLYKCKGPLTNSIFDIIYDTIYRD
jgi:hypothetical protein